MAGTCTSIRPRLIGSSSIIEISRFINRTGVPFSVRISTRTRGHGGGLTAITSREEGPSCIFVGPIDSARKETLEALYRQVKTMRTRHAKGKDGVDMENTTEHGTRSRSIQKIKKKSNKKKQKPSQEVGPSGTYTGSGEEEMVPVQPMGFFFEPSEFSKITKFGTRCDPQVCVEFIRNRGGNELKWFMRHPQFRHIFHMPQEKNRKVMGAWTLIQRMAKTEKPQQMWFVVNGVPIRYGLREHGLMCGLYCQQYPDYYENLEGNLLVTKHFGKDANPWPDHVFNKMSSMSPSEDRLKMTVLWFLATVIRGKTKVSGPIDPFIRKIVNDLPKCVTFPWGRLTFEELEKDILGVHNRMKGSVSPSTVVPGFIVPFELLPFEAIHNLKKSFRERVPCEDKCPRMCKGRFKELHTKGFGLGDIYKAVGDSTDISSILKAKGEERDLLEEIMGEEDDLKYDMIVDGWTTIIAKGGRILWTDLLERDLAHRNHPTRAIAAPPTRATAAIACDAPPLSLDDQVAPPGVRESIAEISKAVMEGFKTLNAKVGKMEVKIDTFSSRIDLLEKSKSHGRRSSPIANVYDKAAGKKVIETGDDSDEEDDTGDEEDDTGDEEDDTGDEEGKVEEEEEKSEEDEEEDEEKVEEEDEEKVEEEDEEDEEDNDDDKEGEKEDDHDDDGFDGFDGSDGTEGTVVAQGSGVAETQFDDCSPHGPTGYTGFSRFTSNIFDSFVAPPTATEENVIHLGFPSVDEEEEEKTEPHANDDDVCPVINLGSPTEEEEREETHANDDDGYTPATVEREQTQGRPEKRKGRRRMKNLAEFSYVKNGGKKSIFFSNLDDNEEEDNDVELIA